MRLIHSSGVPLSRLLYSSFLTCHLRMSESLTHLQVSALCNDNHLCKQSFLALRTSSWLLQALTFISLSRSVKVLCLAFFMVSWNQFTSGGSHLRRFSLKAR